MMARGYDFVLNQRNYEYEFIHTQIVLIFHMSNCWKVSTFICWYECDLSRKKRDKYKDVLAAHIPLTGLFSKLQKYDIAIRTLHHCVRVFLSQE